MILIIVKMRMKKIAEEVLVVMNNNRIKFFVINLKKIKKSKNQKIKNQKSKFEKQKINRITKSK